MSLKSQSDTAAGARPGRVWLASWAFWLAIAAVGVGLPAHALQVHAHAFRQWHETFRLRAGICKALAAQPRPAPEECWRRAGQPMVNLIASRGPGEPA